ncbi:MAG: flavodoxin family protein [Christensenellaceae bacterium]
MQNHIAAQYYDISNADIKPCYGCQGCTYKTFGRCVFRDDCDTILPDIMRAESIVFVSPVRFGSYSFRAKRMIDKFSLAGSRYYQVKNGELVKSVQGTQKRLLFIGILSDESKQSRTAFEQLTHETRSITDCEGKTFIIEDRETIQQTIEQIGREVESFA